MRQLIQLKVDLERADIDPSCMTILPAQWVDQFRRALQPEQRLMLAVLEEAINCLQQYHQMTSHRARRLFCEAEEWIMHDDFHWPFSFARICLALAIDHEYLRAGIQRWMTQLPQGRKRYDLCSPNALIGPNRRLRRSTGRYASQRVGKSRMPPI